MHTEQAWYEGKICIVESIRRWVFVGICFRNADQIRIEDARVVRQWGTTEGLPQLIAEGPLENTVIDHVEEPIRLFVPRITAHVWEGNPEKWEPEFDRSVVPKLPKGEIMMKVNNKVCIVESIRRWVFVGKCFNQPDQIQIDDAQVVREWGTSKGLPQLAAMGPLQPTKLDVGSVPPRLYVPRITAHVWECNQKNWEQQIRVMKDSEGATE
jgi:hypothetical protein